VNEASDLGPVNKGAQGVQRLYRLNPVMLGWDGDAHEYVVVSAVQTILGPETYVFAADESGVITKWTELDGSYRGGLSHEEALRNAGYEVVTETKRLRVRGKTIAEVELWKPE
jgi:hypothetical protein